MSNTAGQPDENPRPQAVDSPVTYGLVWLGLMLLLGLTVVCAHAFSGTPGTAVGLAIAAAKAALIVWVFLHLRHHHGLTRVAAGFALLWLALLITLVLSDYLTRTPQPT